MAASTPVLVLTPGEPAGIGPEIAVRQALAETGRRLLLVADPSLLQRTAERLGLTAEVTSWAPGESLEPGRIHCWPVPMPEPAVPGRLNPANAGYVLDCLIEAVSLVEDGTARAMVTGPVHKGVINDAGIGFSGHTEFLAARCGVARVVMLLVTGSLRVALATTHLPLRAVPDALTTHLLLDTLRILDADLRRRFAIPEPRIVVLGLNPHAGEGGHLGREEAQVIAPAIEQAAAEGMAVRGPVPADTAFTPVALGECDAVLAMYHDQGLPVLKHVGFGGAVNVTLGLPFVRTSVDHGTALDIAGTGRASGTSLEEALRLAQDLSRAGRR